MLEVNNLSVCTFDKNYLLRDICFKLSCGDSLGIIGKSGDGKSTLAKAIIGIYDNGVSCETGSIIYNSKLFSNDLRGKVFSLMFQNPNTYLNPLIKVGKQISEMLTYHYKDDKKVAKDKTIALMKKVGLPNPEKLYNYYPYELSGGMQQKICLCISLICKPKVLIMDESTSFLDKESEKEILKLIKEFQKEYGFILIMISHDFKLIYSMCNKIAIMRKGQMIELGKKDEIILNPIHPYTVELLCNYFSFYKDIETFECPLMNIELEECPSIVNISKTHYVRSFYLDPRAIKINYPKNIESIKEEIYESLRN